MTLSKMFKTYFAYTDVSVAIDFIELVSPFKNKATLHPSGKYYYYGFGSRAEEGDTLSFTNGEILLINDLLALRDQLSTLIKIPVTNKQFTAIISFVYSLDLETVQNTDFFKELNKNNYLKVAEIMLQFTFNNQAKYKKRRVLEVAALLQGEPIDTGSLFA